MGTMDMMKSMVTMVSMGMGEEIMDIMVNMVTSMETMKEEAVKEIMDIMVSTVMRMEILKEEVEKEIMDIKATMMERKMNMMILGMVMVLTMMKNKLKIISS